MSALKMFLLALTLVAMPLVLPAQEASTPTQPEVLDKIVAQEKAEMESLRHYSPLVETYVQTRRPDKELGTVPGGDQYFLGRAKLAKGVELVPLTEDTRTKHSKIIGQFENFWSMEFLPRGFLQMIYLDTNGFDQNHYKFSYVRREFLGEVRCMVFDVDPRAKSAKGRFVGRIWVEDRDYHIVRFNGTYKGSTKISYYFSFDSWRQNAGKNEWLPAFIFSQEGNVYYPMAKEQILPPFRAQTRLWGYALGAGREEQELSRVLMETPVIDKTENANDYSPLEAERAWSRQAEDNVVESLERHGLVAPDGEVNKVLEAVVRNLELTNDLDIQPEVRCRVLMASTLESFTMGHTIVLSRGLLDVLPDEASLAAILAHELGHVVLAHPMDTQFAFFNRLRFDEKETFHHFDFSRPPEEERAANRKGSELLMKSPYKDQLASAQRFLQALQGRSKDIPNLISPHLGESLSTSWTVAPGRPLDDPPAGSTANVPASTLLAALPLGGRIKVDIFNDQLHFLKARAAGTVAEYEKMPFEITPFMLYLTRQADGSTIEAPAEQAAKSLR
jgi:Peptidase family M48